MIDTGAEIGTVKKDVGDQFDWTQKVGVTAKPTTGAGYAVGYGMLAEIAVDDHSGIPRPRTSACAMGVKSTNDGSNIIGMDQLESVDAFVMWDPVAQLGTLRAR